MLEHLPTESSHALAHCRAASESNFVDIRVGHQILAGLSTRRENAHDSLRQANLLQDFPQDVGVQWCRRGRLEDDATSREQGWSQLQKRQDQWLIPGTPAPHPPPPPPPPPPI